MAGGGRTKDSGGRDVREPRTMGEAEGKDSGEGDQGQWWQCGSGTKDSGGRVVGGGEDEGPGWQGCRVGRLRRVGRKNAAA